MPAEKRTRYGNSDHAIFLAEGGKVTPERFHLHPHNRWKSEWVYARSESLVPVFGSVNEVHDKIMYISTSK